MVRVEHPQSRLHEPEADGACGSGDHQFAAALFARMVGVEVDAEEISRRAT